MPLKFTVCAVGATLLFASFSMNAQQYTVTDLGTLGGSDSYGYGINASGQVAGVSQTAGNSASHAFLYSNGTMRDLATLDGGCCSAGFGINAIGQVVGWSTYRSSTRKTHAFLYSDGAMQKLGALSRAYSQAYAINNSGQVTGYYVPSSEAANFNLSMDPAGADDSFPGAGYAFIYSNGTVQNLGTFGGTGSKGYGINDSGQVTGASDYNTNPFYSAFLYSNGSMNNLGTFGGHDSAGSGINASGQVTGWADHLYTKRAFLYSNGLMEDLGSLAGYESWGQGINTSGQVTGAAFFKHQVAIHAFIYSDGDMLDLNTLIGSAASLYTLTSGESINDAGQIVVNGTVNAAGNRVALLLTPTTAISTSTKISSLAGSSTYGSAITLTALVMPSSGSAPTGSVMFYADAAYLGTAALNGTGQAVLTTNTIPGGMQSLTAAYSGGSPDLGSTSAAVAITVTPAETQTSLTASPSRVRSGKAVTLTATVVPTTGSAVPAGNVTLLDGTTTLATVTLNGSGVATYVTTTLAEGKHEIKAEYAGTADDHKSHSAVVKVTIT